MGPGKKIASGAGAAEVDPAEVGAAEAGAAEAGEPGVDAPEIGSAELGAEAGAEVPTEAAQPVAPAGVQAVCGSAVAGETVASEPRQMLAAHTIIANRQTAPRNQRILKL